MDINALGTQYLNQQFVPFSSSSAPAASGLQSGGDNSFRELLKRTQSAKDSSPAPAQKTTIDKTSKLYELCTELETFLIKSLIKSMRGTVQKTKLIDTGFAGEIYEDMLYDEYAKSYARNANLGFAEMAYKELAGLR